ncbi:MAG: ABC transporter substrate-binding protein [Myxococcota bacterium]|nr:ABC transporter substrate-binding protein [Myxococcota bacterium]
MSLAPRPRKPSTWLFSLALILVWGVGCAGFGGAHDRDRANAQEQAAYDQALAEWPADPVAASTALETFVQTYPQSPLADDALEQLARMALAEGRSDEAFTRLQSLIERYPKGDRADAARLRLARWENSRGRPDQARQWLSGLEASQLDAVQQRIFYRLQAELAVDPVERVIALSALRANLASAQAAAESDSKAATEAAEALSAVDTEIDGQLETLTIEELGRLAVALSDPAPPAGRIRLMLARRALETGDPENAQRLLEKAGEFPLTPRDEARRVALERRLGLASETAGRAALPTWSVAAATQRVSTEKVTATIGVLLPLSGRLAPFGEEALRGILLAAEVFDVVPPSPRDPNSLPRRSKPSRNSTPPAAGAATGDGEDLSAFSSSGEPLSDPVREGVRLLIRDTAGDPARAAAAVEELAENEEVVAVIGPILSGTSDAAAAVAQSAGLPLLTLSNRVEISHDRDYVFRLRMTPADEVGFLVDYAYDQLAARRFAVLYPRSRYGRGMRERYWEAVLDRGGSVVATASYDPDATDYSDAIRSLAGFDLLTSQEGAALEERAQAMRRGRRLEPEDAALLRTTLYEQLGPEAEPLPPIVDFDALFIPDAHERIQLVVPQLAFHEVGPIQLLGTGEWNDPELLRVGRGHVRGAVIATPYDEASPYEAVQRFTETYATSFGQAAEPLSSEAYDATHIVLEQVAEGRADRDALREGILALKAYPGVSGVIRFEPDGNARKRPFLLKAQRGRFVPVD